MGGRGREREERKSEVGSKMEEGGWSEGNSYRKGGKIEWRVRREREEIERVSESERVVR